MLREQKERDPSSLKNSSFPFQIVVHHCWMGLASSIRRGRGETRTIPLCGRRCAIHVHKNISISGSQTPENGSSSSSPLLFKAGGCCSHISIHTPSSHISDHRNKNMLHHFAQFIVIIHFTCILFSVPFWLHFSFWKEEAERRRSRRSHKYRKFTIQFLHLSPVRSFSYPFLALFATFCSGT